MSNLNLPEKYHVVWLDDHIGMREFCVQLKRAFFTQIDPSSGDEISMSDTDIDLAIQNDREIPLKFDNFHFTLSPFIEENACLEYIDEIKDDRILFITSNKLGESAVPKLLTQYPSTFTDQITKQPYTSVYLFCLNIEKAKEWAVEYVDYINIFDFETDLLARMTRDLGIEFLKHGKWLVDLNQNEAAVTRLSWSRTLFIRHHKLMLPVLCNTEAKSTSDEKQSLISPMLQEIDQLIHLLEKRMQQEQEQETESDHDNLHTQLTADNKFIPDADHLIVLLNEGSRGDEEFQIEKAYRIYSDDMYPAAECHFNTETFVQFEHKIKALFSNFSSTIECFYGIEHCRQYIMNSGRNNKIFFITSSSSAKRILPFLMTNSNIELKIYILDDYTSQKLDWIDTYQDQWIRILLFDRSNALITRISEDLCEHYLRKARNERNKNLTPFNSTFVYFDRAKEIVTNINQLNTNECQEKLNTIEKSRNETEKSVEHTTSIFNVQQQIYTYNIEIDSNEFTIPVVIVGLDSSLIHLDSSIGKLFMIKANEQLVSILVNTRGIYPIIVVSSTEPSHELLSLKQKIHYYVFSLSSDTLISSTAKYSNVTYAYGIENLMNHLHNRLGQYYRDAALESRTNCQNREQAKLLLEKSTLCYKLLKSDTEKTLKRYADILKNKPDKIDQ